MRINMPIIPVALALLESIGTKCDSKSQFDFELRKQNFFSLSLSHCFYDEKAYNEFHKNGSVNTNKDAVESVIAKNVGELVAVWDNANSIGYIITNDKIN